MAVEGASGDGTTGQPWTDIEIEATIAAYVEMLAMEVRGERFRKTDVVRRLQASMPARSSRAIEAKFQNISAIQEEAGLLWIDGYKPLPHYQKALKDTVLARPSLDTGSATRWRRSIQRTIAAATTPGHR